LSVNHNNVNYTRYFFFALAFWSFATTFALAKFVQTYNLYTTYIYIADLALMLGQL
jgi:hypothetical protein